MKSSCDITENSFFFIVSLLMGGLITSPAATLATVLTSKWGLPIDNPTLAFIGWLVIFLVTSGLSFLAVLAIGGESGEVRSNRDTKVTRKHSLLWDATPKNPVLKLLLGGAFLVSKIATGILLTLWEIIVCFSLVILAIGVGIALQTLVMTTLLLVGSAIAYFLGSIASWMLLSSLLIGGLCFAGHRLRNNQLSEAYSQHN